MANPCHDRKEAFLAVDAANPQRREFVEKLSR
jgi:hypothetical protein